MIATDDRVALFVAQQTGTRIIPPYTAMGIDIGGEIIGGAIFNHFTGADLHLTAAGHGWTRGFLADVGEYVFHQLGCVRMTAITEQPKVVRLAERLGGEVEGLMRNHFGTGRDAFVIGFLKQDWKF